MIYKIENSIFSAEINDMGAELHSFKSKRTGTEFLWFGNPDIWYGQAPVLFPIIGQLAGDSYTVGGKEYSMPKHGLARKLPFKVKSCEGARAVFVLESTEQTLAKYPYAFELQIIFELTDKGITCTSVVINRGKGDMLFSLGAHPGFNCDIGDTIEFEQAETLVTEQINGDNLVIDEKFPVLDNEREIEITPHIFDKDALILSGIKSKSLKIKSPRAKRELEFIFGDCPLLGIWAKPNAPYVCIEPWFGIGDSIHPYGDFSQKRGIQRLGENGVFEYAWSANPTEL